MTPDGLNTICQLLLGVVWGTGMLILWRRYKSKPKLWPRILGIGIGLYGFVSLMTGSMLLWPKSEFLNYTVENLFWSLAGGIVCYFGGRKLARDSETKH
jgi:peptidoglycan/LPS O-acetylase OafA/YrhL